MALSIEHLHVLAHMADVRRAAEQARRTCRALEGQPSRPVLWGRWVRQCAGRLAARARQL
jgi:hypothetical protein